MAAVTIQQLYAKRLRTHGFLANVDIPVSQDPIRVTDSSNLLLLDRTLRPFDSASMSPATRNIEF